MKRLGYFLSILLHALLLLLVLSARFPITIQTEPPRVVTVRIAEPPLPYVPAGVPTAAPGPGASLPAASVLAGAEAAKVPGAGSGPVFPPGSASFAAAGEFSLKSTVPGSFRLAPVGKSPDPWAVPLARQGPARPLRYRVGAYRPGTATGSSGGSGGVFLLPFDVREKAVAEWADAVLARVERNWSIPASGRLAFSGRVQVSLTIERQGRQRALLIDDSTVPEPLTRAALHAVQASLPLPPVPEKVAGESFALTFVFAYNA